MKNDIDVYLRLFWAKNKLWGSTFDEMGILLAAGESGAGTSYIHVVYNIICIVYSLYAWIDMKE